MHALSGRLLLVTLLVIIVSGVVTIIVIQPGRNSFSLVDDVPENKPPPDDVETRLEVFCIDEPYDLLAVPGLQYLNRERLLVELPDKKIYLFAAYDVSTGEQVGWSNIKVALGGGCDVTPDFEVDVGLDSKNESRRSGK